MEWSELMEVNAARHRFYSPGRGMLLSKLMPSYGHPLLNMLFVPSPITLDQVTYDAWKFIDSFVHDVQVNLGPLDLCQLRLRSCAKRCIAGWPLSTCVGHWQLGMCIHCCKCWSKLCGLSALSDDPYFSNRLSGGQCSNWCGPQPPGYQLQLWFDVCSLLPSGEEWNEWAQFTGRTFPVAQLPGGLTHRACEYAGYKYIATSDEPFIGLYQLDVHLNEDCPSRIPAVFNRGYFAEEDCWNSWPDQNRCISSVENIY